MTYMDSNKYKRAKYVKVTGKIVKRKHAKQKAVTHLSTMEKIQPKATDSSTNIRSLSGSS